MLLRIRLTIVLAVMQDETLAGPDTQQEMCNMFMMVWSENPYFLVRPE